MSCKKKFVIGVSSFNYGGIEVLVSKISKALALDFEVIVYILCNKFDESLLLDLESHATVYLAKDFLKMPMNLIDIVGLNSISPVKSIHKSIINNANYIHATDSNTLMFFINNLTRNNPVKLSVGNYQSEEYIWESRFFFRKVEENVFRSVGPASIFSMNDISVKKLMEKYGLKYSISKTMPAGVELPSPDLANLQSRTNSLVCVGRLVEFKSYIKNVIRVVPSILNSVPDFEFHVYGDGPLLADLKDISHGLPVTFHGTIELSRLKSCISTHKVFIGSGTSIVFASAVGVPSIIGIESIKEPKTYGFLHDTKGLDYQEIGLPYDMLDIETKILQGISANTSDYKMLCHKAITRAKAFDIKISVQSLIQNSPIITSKSISKLNKVRYITSFLCWLLLNRLKIIDKKQNRHSI